MEIKVNNFLMKYGFKYLQIKVQFLFLPLIAISIMIISTLTKLYTYKTNKFIENIRQHKFEIDEKIFNESI